MEEFNSLIKKNIHTIQENIGQACKKAGRLSSDVKLMAVTKTLDRTAAEAAIKAGITLFGENRVQEAIEKYTPMTEGITLHLIGHLQRNKAKKAAEFFHCVESIDKYETAQTLELHCMDQGINLPVFLEVNTSGEPSKNGYRSIETLLYDLDKIQKLQHIDVQGLMTIGPFTDDTYKIRKSFGILRNLFEKISFNFSLPRFTELSMGMTGDYETAVEEGATIVRIGTGIFGGRHQ